MGVRLMGSSGWFFRLMGSGEWGLDSWGAVNGCQTHGERLMGVRLMGSGEWGLDSWGEVDVLSDSW